MNFLASYFGNICHHEVFKELFNSILKKGSFADYPLKIAFYFQFTKLIINFEIRNKINMNL